MEANRKFFFALFLLFSIFAINEALDGTVPICPRDGYFPDYDDCTRFVQCVNGEAFIIQCPQNLVWSQEELTCDWSWRAPCQQQPHLAPNP